MIRGHLQAQGSPFCPPRWREADRPGMICDETRIVLKIFFENVINDAVTYTEHASRKTVSALDVLY